LFVGLFHISCAGTHFLKFAYLLAAAALTGFV
jgi:hypothetical protein